jgi:hypothetical protein
MAFADYRAQREACQDARLHMQNRDQRIGAAADAAHTDAWWPLTAMALTGWSAVQRADDRVRGNGLVSAAATDHRFAPEALVAPRGDRRWKRSRDRRARLIRLGSDRIHADPIVRSSRPGRSSSWHSARPAPTPAGESYVAIAIARREAAERVIAIARTAASGCWRFSEVKRAVRMELTRPRIHRARSGTIVMR